MCDDGVSEDEDIFFVYDELLRYKRISILSPNYKWRSVGASSSVHTLLALNVVR